MPISRRLPAITVAVGIVVGGVLGASGVASAAPTDDTTVTFEIEAGTLDITAPASADIGLGTPGGTASGQLGPVTVADTRAALDSAWTASAISTDFTTGGATAPETVDATLVSYWSGAATATTGTGTFTPGQANAGAAVAIDAEETAFTKTGGTGNNSATWNPTLVVAVPGGAVAGVYTGTITQSVA
ncbi:MAG TPA: hypothetical protein VGO60_14310 [Iamia sp.]|jgi:hypothetical protein|nr:hypothetical protein [Iamia sp.]